MFISVPVVQPRVFLRVESIQQNDYASSVLQTYLVDDVYDMIGTVDKKGRKGTKHVHMNYCSICCVMHRR